MSNTIIKQIEGGVCAAKGFKAAGIHAGVKTNNSHKKDVALIVSDCDCNAGAVYTKNVVKAAPLLITKQNLENGHARAIIANSGNANACAPNGEINAQKMCRAAAAAIGIDEKDVIVASTGVIGQELAISVIEKRAGELAAGLSYDGSQDAASAIMTTDLARKEYAVEFSLGGKTVKIGGIAKGSGMIHPNMGTMLAFLTTDCAIGSKMIQKALVEAAKVSFNRISVDGDTSTNDMLCLLANGMAGNNEISDELAEQIDVWYDLTPQGGVADKEEPPGAAAFDTFCEALNTVCIELAKMMAADGEGATHMITCHVAGAASEEDAETLAKSVISSTLTKAAIFGSDANWGRVLCAMGYSGIDFDPNSIDIAFESEAGKVVVCENGRGLPFDEDVAKKILTEHDITIDIAVKAGASKCTCWGCDITYDYIKINGDYRT